MLSKFWDMSYKRLGDYIERVFQKNSDDSIKDVMGVSERKIFREPSGKVNKENLSNHLIVRKNEFAYIPRMNPFKPLAVALSNYDYPILVSASYVAFKVKNTKVLLPEFLLLFLRRDEFDRFAAFNAWSSTRDTFDWADMCEVKIPLPNIDEQQKYVALYSAILSNQKTYQNSLADLQLICDTYIENLIKTEKPKVLGEYIERIIQKNSDDTIKNVIGISERKVFREPSGKVNKENLSNHLIVRKNEFAYIPRMNTFKPLAVALSHYDYPVVVSASYVTFKVKNTNILLPEFLLLFLKMAEFDRYAAFNAWSSTRDTFDWGDMCIVTLPIPDIKIQEAIVTIYHTLETRKRVNEQLKNTIKPLCPVLMRGVVENIAVNTLA